MSFIKLIGVLDIFTDMFYPREFDSNMILQLLDIALKINPLAIPEATNLFTKIFMIIYEIGSNKPLVKNWLAIRVRCNSFFKVINTYYN